MPSTCKLQAGDPGKPAECVFESEGPKVLELGVLIARAEEQDVSTQEACVGGVMNEFTPLLFCSLWVPKQLENTHSHG